MIVTLPWPPRDLSANSRTHWARKAKAVKAYRSLAYWSAIAAGPIPGETIAITFNPPDKRRRDLDGMLSQIKAGLDGIADATGVDDSKWQISIRKGEPVKGGQVVVEVQP